MQNIIEAISQTVDYLKSNGIDKPPLAGVILGTGLNSLVHHISIEKSFNYEAIPHFVSATVEFHKGMLHYGTIENVPVVVMQGRFHYYEGYSMQQITYPVRVMKALGIKYLLLSNAAGGMNPEYKKGDLVCIEDHINLLPENPLRGLSDSALGPRFTDMSCPYDLSLNKSIIEIAIAAGTTIKSGVYVSVMGPNLETRAEYRWLRNTGADMVGMSTVPEVIVANQSGIKSVAISVITDECDPDNLKPIEITEIIEIAGKADKILAMIFVQLIKHLGLSVDSFTA